ncbi:alpha/beta hydrolase [Dongia sp. agr-C8]
MAVTVYFGTNRNAILGPVPNNFGTDFSPSGGLTCGRAVITSVADESEIGNSNIAIDSVTPGGFSPLLQSEIAAGNAKHLLIYLHGFDYRFREVMMRAAMLGDWFGKGSPKVPSTLLAFTWPSLGSLSIDAYRTDYRSSGLSGIAFRSFLQALLPTLKAFKQGGANRRVTLLAHSMGNHFLRAGLAAAVGTAPGQIAPSDLRAVIDRVVLAASDEDVDSLSRPDGLGISLGICDRVYLYYNNQDVPLSLISRPVHGVGRLGIDGPPDKESFLGHNITFVNCSAANPFVNKKKEIRLDPQWHQYYRLVPEVRNDLCGAMLGVDDAAMPNRTYRKKGNYWRLDLAK